MHFDIILSSPSLRFQFLGQQIEMQGIAESVSETKVRIIGTCGVIFGMNDKRPNPCDICGLKCAQHGIFQ